MIQLKIEGMSCQHCVMTVTKALKAVHGVTKVVEVNLARGEARVEGTAEPSALVIAVQEQGYQARLLPTA